MTELAQANHVATTDQKRYPVGMPIQAAAEAMELILGRHRPTPDQIVDIECRLPSHGARIVGDRTIPDINLQYVLAVQVLDGRLTFESAHDYERISDPATQRLMERINLVADDSLEPPDVASPETRRTRIADLRIRLTDGTELRERVDGPLGTRFRPFGWNHLAEKAHMVLDGSHGSDFADELVAIVQTLGSRSVIADLQPLLRVPAM